MLIEIWERLRGYDKWIETDATVESSEAANYQLHGRDLSSSEDVIVWTDAGGEKHRAPFRVQADSPLFQLVQGSTISIRYNPADPEEYYFRELLQARVRDLRGGWDRWMGGCGDAWVAQSGQCLPAGRRARYGAKATAILRA